MILTKDQIFTANQLQHEDVEIPDWGGSVRIRELTVGEANEIRQLAESLSDKGDTLRTEAVSKKTLSLGAIDPSTGGRLFTEEDVERISERKSVGILMLAAAIMSLSGMTPATAEEPEKNSEPAQVDASSSS